MKIDNVMKRSRGFTLLEALIVIVISSLLLGLGIPSFQGILERNRMMQAAESVRSDLQLARTEAVKRNTNIRVSYDTDAWCYGINDDSTACACSTANDCGIKAISGAQFNDVDMDSAGSTTFNFMRGTANASRVCLSTDDYQLKVVVNNMGRVKICNPPSASNDILNYETCTTDC